MNKILLLLINPSKLHKNSVAQRPWCAALGAAALVLMGAGQASAQTSGTWTSGTGTYSNAGNWSGGTVATGTDAAMFIGNGGANITEDQASLTLGRIQVAVGGPNYQIFFAGSSATNALTFATSTGTPSIYTSNYYSGTVYLGNLTIAGNQGINITTGYNTLVLQSGLNWTMTGTMTSDGSGGGAGNLYAQGNNVLPHSMDLDLGNTNNGSLLVLNGGTTQTTGALIGGGANEYIAAYSGNNNFQGNVSSGTNVLGSTSAATLQVGNTNDSGTFNGIIGQSFSADTTAAAAAINLVKVGTGTQTLTGVNTYTGTTTVSGGVLAIGGAGNLGSGTYANSVSIASGATLAYSSTATQTLSGVVSGAGTLTVGSGSGTAGTASTLILTGNNSSTDSLSVNVGNGATLQLQANAGNTASGTSTALSSTATLNLYNNSTLQLLSDSSVTFAGGTALGNNGNGGMTYNFSVNNLGTGGDTNSGNTITFAPNGWSPNYSGFGQTDTINVSGGNGYSLAMGALNVNFGADLTINTTTANLSIAGVTNSIHNLTKQGSGTLTIGSAGLATNFGPLTLALQNGVVVMGAGSSVPSASTGFILTEGSGSNSGVFQLGDSTAAVNLTVTGLTTSGTGNGNAVVGGNASDSTLTISTSGADVFAGTLGGTETNQNNLALTKMGAGTLSLSGVETYTGPTTVSGGALSLTGSLSGSNISTNNSGFVSETSSGTINGTGVTFTQSSTGTTVLAGTNTYTGGTNLSSGAIYVIGAGTLGSAVGSLTIAGGTLDLGATSQTVGAVRITGGSTIQNGILTANSYSDTTTTGTVTVNAVLAGAGALAKSGAGILALNGANTYGAGTTISGGTVAVGNLSALGTGNVSLSGGILETGNGVHQINAVSYTQTGGTLVLDLTGTSPGTSPGYEFLHVTGTAALGGALQVNMASPYVPTTGDAFTFIQAASITGGFTSISTNLSSLSITQQGNGVIIGQLPFATLPNVTYTPNESAVAQYVDTSFKMGASGSAFRTLLGALNNLTATGSSPNALPAAFSQLSPAKFGSFASSTVINNAVFSTQLLDASLAGQRSDVGDFMGGNGQIDSSGLTAIDPNTNPGLTQLSSRLLAWNPAPPGHGMLSDTSDPILAGIDLKEMKPAISPSQSQDFSMSVSGNVVLAQNFSQADLPHQDTTTGAMQVGAQYRISPHLRLGALFAYGHTDANLDDTGSKATVDTYSPGVYVSYAEKGWYANALGSYGFDSFTEDRNVSFGGLSGIAHGAPNADQIVGDLDGGYDFHMAQWTFGPQVGLQYTQLDVQSFTEEGAAPIDLQINKQETDSLRSRVGGHVSLAFHAGRVVLTPHLDASWQHEFMDQSCDITSQFTSVGAGSFSVYTPHVSRDSALIDGGLSGEFNGQLTFYLDYLIQAGQSNYIGQSIQAGIKFGF